MDCKVSVTTLLTLLGHSVSGAGMVEVGYPGLVSLLITYPRSEAKIGYCHSTVITQTLPTLLTIISSQEKLLCVSKTKVNSYTVTHRL